MNPISKPIDHSDPLPRPSLARRFALLAMPSLLALGLSAPQARAAELRLDLTTNGGASAVGWTPVTLAAATAVGGIPNVGGSGLNFSFINVGAFQTGNTAQPLTRAGFHNSNNYTTAKTFTLSGLTPNKPVKLYASAAWDGNGAGGYLVYGSTGATGVKAQTIGDPGTTPTVANLTLIGTATADGTGTVTGGLWGRNSATAVNNAEGQVGAFVFAPTQTITASATANGTISPPGTTDVFAGDSLTYTITPDGGSHIVDVLVNSVSVGAIGSYTFTNVQANSTISASFAPNTFTHTITATAGANGSISPSGAVTPNNGVSQRFDITPDTGYHIADVLVDGSSVGAVSSYIFPNVSANHTIAASFAINTFTIAASSGPNGTVTPSGVSTVNFGDSPEYIITPASGYYISEILVDGVAVVAPTSSYTFSSVTANHTISAAFDNRTRYLLDFAVVGGGVTSGWTPVYQTTNQVNLVDFDGLGHGFTFGNVGSFDNGNATQSLTRGGFFNLNGTALPHPFSLTGLIPGQQVALYASAGWDTGAGAYIVYGDSGAAGKKAVTVGNPGTNPVLSNLTLIGTATVDGTGKVAGSMFGSNSITSGAQGQLGGFIFAASAPPIWTITATAGANGTITPSGAVGVTSGDNQSFAITPNTGFHVADVLVDGVSVGAISDYTFNVVTAPHTISATFAVNTTVYTINASAGANGTISPNGPVSANQGVNIPFTITPNTGYHVANVLVDGVSVGPVTSYTFTNVQANHTIAASFAIDTFTITATAGPNGSISPGTSVVNFGDSLEYFFTPAPGYFIEDIYVDGVLVSFASSSVNSYQFTNVTANHTISVSFDNRFKLLLDFTTNAGGAFASGWNPVYANDVNDTNVNEQDIGGTPYDLTFAHVGSYQTPNTATQPLTRSGFYNFGRDTNDHTFVLKGLNAGQTVALYAVAGWDAGRGGYVVYGDSGASGVKAVTIGNPGTGPTLANFTLIGTAVSDSSGKVTGALHGEFGIGTASEGQVGAFVFAITPGGTPPTATPFDDWAASFNLTGNDALPGSDPDFDGVSNRIEFGLNGSPVNGASRGLSSAQMATVATVPNVMTLTIAVRDGAVFSALGNRMKSAIVDGIAYTIEASDNLALWGGPVVTEVTGADADTIQLGLPAPDTGWSYKTFRTDGDSTTDSSDFMRAGVE